MRALVVAMIVLCGQAYGDDTKPWAVGISDAEQKLALDKFQKGNDSFVKDEWAVALELYIQALAHWDHPNIRYNAAVCLLKLDRKVEAFEHMTAALRYGEGPLGKDLHAPGPAYWKELKTKVAHVRVACDDAALRVTLDGDTIKCGETKLVTPTKHLVVAEKPGYKTFTHEVTPGGGGTESVSPDMQLEGTRKLVRRFPRWMPWTVLGVGAALGVASGPLFLVSRNKFDDYESHLARDCGTDPTNGQGCAPNDPKIRALDRELSSAKTYRALTISAIALGATGVGVGILLIVMNQPHYANVTPTVGNDHVGLAVTADF